MVSAELARRIVAAMIARGYRIDRGQDELTIVYLEGANADGSENDDRPNVFNDRRIVIRFVNGEPAIVGNWDATTEPGTRYVQRPINVKGAARIQFGQYRAWRVGVHRGNHEALVQTGGAVTVCRDLNKDHERDGDKLDTGYFGINQHHGHNASVGDIGPHSAGCLVSPKIEEHRAFMALIKTDPRYRDDGKFVFTTTVMPAAWLVSIPTPHPRESKTADVPLKKIGLWSAFLAVGAAVGTWFSDRSILAFVVFFAVLCAVALIFFNRKR